MVRDQGSVVRGREGTVSGRESGLFVLKMLSVELNIDDSR